ncbi:MAG: divergent polysaccharide deacetylase family protein, partial [Alphaproteobacteria bacterium]|nr:divergent polysaccharide deacetylase family protein [Alphaproteobacteria bacterium]
MSGAVTRRGPHPLALAWFLLFALLTAAVVYVAVFGKAKDGEPVARLDLKPLAAPARPGPKPPAKPVQQAEVQPQPGPAQPATTQPGTAQPAIAAPPAKAPEPAEPPQLVPPKIVSPVYAGKALVADPALIEPTREGPLPRIADNGRTPMAAYAPPVATPKGKPQIALVISGLGVSAKATEAALKTLPPGVTLAFAPYAGDAQRWVSEARRLGHEVLLEVPMEPYDFPDSDPGPHTLRPTLDENGNLDRLRWALTRFT